MTSGRPMMGGVAERWTNACLRLSDPTGALPAVAFRSATCASAAEHRYYRTKPAPGESRAARIKPGRAREKKRLKRPRQAPKSSKQKGKLAQRPNSSTVNQITSAGREVRRSRNYGVTDPRHQHSKRGTRAAGATRLNQRAQYQSTHAQHPTFQVNSHADPIPERNS